MAFYDKPFMSFSLPGVELEDTLPVAQRVHVAVAECSPRDHILVVKATSSLSLPQGKAYSSVINEDVKFTFNEERCRVDIYTDTPAEHPFQNPFSLYFPDETNFWSFVAAISRARIAFATQLENLKDLKQEIIDTLLTVDPMSGVL